MWDRTMGEGSLARAGTPRGDSTGKLGAGGTPLFQRPLPPGVTTSIPVVRTWQGPALGAQEHVFQSSMGALN